MPNIEPFINKIKNQGYNITEKGLLSLNLAAVDASKNSYASIYEDSILTGLINANSIIANIFIDENIETIMLKLEKEFLNINLCRSNYWRFLKNEDKKSIYARTKNGYFKRTA